MSPRATTLRISAEGRVDQPLRVAHIATPVEVVRPGHILAIPTVEQRVETPASRTPHGRSARTGAARRGGRARRARRGARFIPARCPLWFSIMSTLSRKSPSTPLARIDGAMSFAIACRKPGFATLAYHSPSSRPTARAGRASASRTRGGSPRSSRRSGRRGRSSRDRGARRRPPPSPPRRRRRRGRTARAGRRSPRRSRRASRCRSRRRTTMPESTLGESSPRTPAGEAEDVARVVPRTWRELFPRTWRELFPRQRGRRASSRRRSRLTCASR